MSFSFFLILTQVYGIDFPIQKMRDLKRPSNSDRVVMKMELSDIEIHALTSRLC